MNINTLIIEDNLNAVEVLEKIVSQFSEIKIIGTSTSKDDAISKIKYFKPDLLFLDIQLGNHNAFEVLQECQGYYKFIIFITAYDSFALKAYDYNTIHYILKPITKEDLVLALNKIKKLQECKTLSPSADFELLNKATSQEKDNETNKTNDEFYYYYLNKQWKSVDKKDVMYLYGESSYTTIYTKDGEFKVSKNLKTTGAEFLTQSNFIRIQKKYIINTNFIESVVRGIKPKVILKNKKEISISLMLKDKVFTKIGIIVKKISP